jgi:hypothetical protein
MENEILLHEEIVDEFKQLKGIEVGTEEYKVTVDGLTKLLDREIEIKKLELERIDKQNTAEAEEKLRDEQMKREARDRWIRLGMDVAGIIIPVTVTIWGTVKSFEFEKEGSITTIMGRGFINKLLPKK